MFGETLALPGPWKCMAGSGKLHLISTPRFDASGISQRSCLYWLMFCIDQSSVDEHNSQVLLMKSVYSKVAMVRVWLGESTPGSDEAIEILKEFSRGASFGDIRINGGPLGYITYMVR